MAIIEQLDTYGPQRCVQLNPEQAAAYTRRLVRSHSENFTVISWLLPRPLREDFRNLYAFCRWADDLGDETGDPARSLELLAWWRRELDDGYAGRPRHPVFVALASTIEKHDIPKKPFADLIDAFVQDQRTDRYETWDQVVDYCSRSANPVGRLVLYVCGYRDENRQQLSDATCTALQLANFWQDVRRDVLERDRVYIPRKVAAKHDLDLALMVTAIKADAARQRDCATCATSIRSAGIRAVQPAYVKTLRELVDGTWPLFQRGRALWPLVAPQVRVDIKLFSRGGEAILRKIERLDYNTLQIRPKLSKGAKIALMLQAVMGKVTTARRGGDENNP